MYFWSQMAYYNAITQYAGSFTHYIEFISCFAILEL